MTVFKNVYITDPDTGKRCSVRPLLPTDDTGALNIHDLDNHRKILIEPFLKYSGTTETINSAVSAGDTSIVVTDGSTFSVGNKVKITESGTCEPGFLVITSIASNTLTLDRPVDCAFTTSGVVEIVDDNMNVLGTLASPVKFELKPPTTGNQSSWHIDRIILTSTDGNAMDDGKFSGIAALTNGLVIRENRARGLHTIVNWKNNEDMRRTFYDLEYTPSAPAGQNGMVGRFTNKRVDVIYDIVGADNDTMEVLVQDDLSDLTTFKIAAEGHFAVL